MSRYRHLYVHIPFCDVICHYCHFYTAPAKGAAQEAFFAALERELDGWLPQMAPELDAIYFGGGTPGASPPDLLAGFLKKLRGKIHAGTEVTLETNPGNVTADSARQWRESGINRVSLGVQSLNDKLLKKVGRAHSAAKAVEALETCAKEFKNLTVDLLYGIPEQEVDEPRKHAGQLLQCGARHISAYHLSLEPSHFLFPKLPPDDFALEQIRAIADFLVPRGYHHYEVASFCEPGFESRNNGNYWSGGPYLALGPSAHSFDGLHTRWRNLSNWQEYIGRIQRGESPVSVTENLSQEQRRIEVIFTSLRTSKGLDLRAFRAQFGQDLRQTHAPLLQRWQEEGLAEIRAERLQLTFAGRMLCDEIAQRLI
jgi:oxygen-independent coproporphyrinogen III oxidase